MMKKALAILMVLASILAALAIGYTAGKNHVIYGLQIDKVEATSALISIDGEQYIYNM